MIGVEETVYRKRNSDLQRPVQEYMEAIRDESALLAINPDIDRLEKVLLNAIEPYCVTFVLRMALTVV